MRATGCQRPEEVLPDPGRLPAPRRRARARRGRRQLQVSGRDPLAGGRKRLRQDDDGRCIFRAKKPTAGQILFHTADGAVVDVAAAPNSELKPLRRQMQMIFQDPFSSLNARMTLLDIIGEPLLVHKIAKGPAIQERVAELLRLGFR